MQIPVPQKPNSSVLFTGWKDVLDKLAHIFVPHANSQKKCKTSPFPWINTRLIYWASFSHVFWTSQALEWHCCKCQLCNLCSQRCGQQCVFLLSPKTCHTCWCCCSKCGGGSCGWAGEYYNVSHIHHACCTAFWYGWLIWLCPLVDIFYLRKIGACVW